MPEVITYKCPKCSATLKPARAIPAGKKIKCPKCENVFQPEGDAAPAPAVKPAAVAPKAGEDEDGAGTYGFKQEEPPPQADASAALTAEDDKPRKKKKGDDGDEKEKKDKSASVRKKGAAQAICQKPSNQLLATGSIACVSCVITVMAVLWPLVFTQNRTWDTELIGIEHFPRLLLLLLTVGAFLYNGAIAVGAVKMQSVESLKWATMACFMMINPVNWLLAIPTFAWFIKLLYSMLGDNSLGVITVFFVSVFYVYVGLRNLKTLRDPEVLAGFAEKTMDY
jgi:hypothetical protein